MQRLLSGASLAILSAAALAATAGGAHAQDASTAPTEVVVTAQKRAQNLQDVPQAIQAVSGAQLRSEGVVEFTDLTKVAPSLIVRPAEQPVNSSVSIRGVGTFAFSIGVEPDVAIIVDDVPVAFEARAFADLNDIQRIEVLRGPQSTLYGKSASAGLINIVTPTPSTSGVTGRLSVMGTTDSEFQLGGAVSGPITDTLAGRVSVNYDNFPGNVKNLYDNGEVNGRELGSMTGKLLWTPIPKFTALLDVNFTGGDNTIGRPFIGLAPNAYLRGNTALPPSVWAPGVTASSDNADVSNNFTSGDRFDAWGESLKLSYDLNFATLMSITSHDFYFLKDRLDVDEGSSPVIDNRQPDGRFTYDQWTEELRLVSRSDQPLRYTAAGGPNQVLSASVRPGWPGPPTQATYPSGRINAAAGAGTAPTTGSSHLPGYSASISRTRSAHGARSKPPGAPRLRSSGRASCSRVKSRSGPSAVTRSRSGMRRPSSGCPSPSS